MIKTGLVSITFRDLPPREIIDLTTRAGLQGIEWGGDVHVPHGDFRKAKAVGQMCRDFGLEVYSYGSYYYLGKSQCEGLDFNTVLETAVNLGIDMIRIWAGRIGSATADSAYREQIIQEAQEIAKIASKERVRLSFEFHRDTLTDTAESTLGLFEQINRENMLTYWQPVNSMSFENRKNTLGAVLPYLSNVHVFHWACDQDVAERLPLQDGIEQWQQYISIISKTAREHALMLEYTKDDSPEQFYRDAQKLKEMVSTEY